MTTESDIINVADVPVADIDQTSFFESAMNPYIKAVLGFANPCTMFSA
jgi:hypothetical protein